MSEVDMNSVTPTGERLVLGDFVAGMIHGVALTSGGSYTFRIDDPSLHAAMLAAFGEIREQSLVAGIDARFALAVDRDTGRSPGLEDKLLQYLFITAKGIDGSYRTFDYDATNPEVVGVLERTPGDMAFWVGLARTFRQVYDSVAA